jgi:hypothetical protein
MEKHTEQPKRGTHHTHRDRRNSRIRSVDPHRIYNCEAFG